MANEVASSTPPSDTQVLPELDQRNMGRTYAMYVVLIILATLAAKFALATQIPYSQALTDDYDYMYKSLCFLQGDWRLTGYSFKKIYTGPAYPFIISPWTLFSNPRHKMLCIYTIHFLFSAGIVAIGASLVSRFSGRRSLLAPIVLATYAPTFLFNYYAMTENVFFFLLILTMWLSVDFHATCTKTWRIICLLGICAIFPMLRTPGFAILPVIWILLFLNRSTLGWKRVGVLAFVVMVFTILPEQFFYHQLYGANRIAGYAQGLTKHFDKSSSESILRPFKFLVLSVSSQIGYALVTTGVWMVPALAAAAAMWRRLPNGETRTAWRNLLAYAIVMGSVLLVFTEAHIASRAHMNPEKANFVIGRYADPTAIVLGFAGFCALMALPRPRWRMQCLLAVVVPLALFLALRAFNDRVYHPMHDIGLSALALRKLRYYPTHFFWIPIVLAVLVGLISRYWAVALRVMLILVIAFNILTLRNGITYTSRWSQRIAGTLKSAEWTVENLPVTTRLACDRNIRFTSPPPGLGNWKWRSVYNVYMAYVLMVHPRHVTYVDIPYETSTPFEDVFGDAEYLLSVLDAVPTVNWGFPIAWQDEHYVIYRLAQDERTEVTPVALSQFDVSRDSMRSDNQIIMAWHNCAATLRAPVHLRKGRYNLVIRATAQGCLETPPQLVVDVTSRDRFTLTLAPGLTQPYAIPLRLDEDTNIHIHLVASEKPRCPDKTDKNIFIESIRIETLDDDSTKAKSAP